MDGLSAMGMLSPYRVLDLATERGVLCGQLLGDMGADVIKIEPPGGSPARRLGPFVNDEPHPDRSLYWWAYNRNKRSITLDIDRPEGRELLKRLVPAAQFLIESFNPGDMAARGLGYETMAALNPALVYVSISAFGQDGPKASYADADLIIMAAGGPLVLTGDDDRPPVRLSVPQAYLHASADAAVGALATQSYVLAAPLGSVEARRMSGGVKFGPLDIPLVWPAKDGYIALTFLFGSALGVFTRKLMEYVCARGFCDEATRDKDWIAFGDQLFSGAEPLSEFERIKQIVMNFTRSHTKAELLQLAVERGFLMTPITTIEEVVKSPQLESRGYWRTLEHPELGRRVTYPGPFAKFSATPLEYRRRPPTIGEHNRQIDCGEMGLSEAELESCRKRNRLMADALPLADVRILDFMWVMAGPAATRMLADYGATVVRIESPTRVDTARTLQPFHNNTPGPDSSGLFGNCNAGKLGISLDLGNPRSREVVFDLLRWAQVVTESFSPKAMRAWGYDYESLRKVKPDLIMVSTCLMGQSGPLSRIAGFGNMAAAISGFHNLTGWADRQPAGPFGAYTDYVSPRFTAMAILAALDHHRRTGEGQYIDQSQAESSLHFLSPAILDYTVNGRIQSRAGNSDREFAPHGVYPAAGEDRWIAIVCQSDSQWRSLCSAIKRADLANDSRLATAAGRREHSAEIDEAISAWTREMGAGAAEAFLQSRAIAAHQVQNSAQIARDPQMAHRGHFVEVNHSTLGKTFVEGPRARLSRTPARVRSAAPFVGEHTQHVLENILHYDEERITDLVAAGVFG